MYEVIETEKTLYLRATPLLLLHFRPSVCLSIVALVVSSGCEGGGAVSPVGVAPTRTVGTSASVIFPCSIKIQKPGGGETQSERSTALC